MITCHIVGRVVRIAQTWITVMPTNQRKDRRQEAVVVLLGERKTKLIVGDIVAIHGATYTVSVKEEGGRKERKHYFDASTWGATIESLLANREFLE